MEKLGKIAVALCVVTGALIALTTAIGRFVSDPERLAQTSGEPAAVINGVVALIASVLLVFVLIALFEQQGDGGGSLRVVARTAALAGTVLLAGDFWFEAFVVPYLADVAPAALGGDPGGALLVGAVVSFVVYAVGWLLFGITSYRDGSLPRAPLILVTAAAVLGAPPGELGKIVFGIALVWLGVSLRRDGEEGVADQEPL
ncbi:MAG: hypothetical protein M3387_12915 [Actinomycetota bacterium]|nr:hypothetical protein [Actinomycetota bacterium]